MKKIIITAVLLAALSPLFGEGTKQFGFDAGLSSGYPLYGGSVNDSVTPVTGINGFKRIIIGLNGDFFYSPVEQIHLFAGADTLADFLWDGGWYSYHFDYAFLFGVKVYPFPGGFAASVAYALGSRNDYYNTTGSGNVTSYAKWGNGFRIGAEFDFSKMLNQKYIPALGFYYRFMPRGNDVYDNIFAAYVSFEL
ncbi:MAG TPA: hypothetical protein DCL73_13120 [Treponema sp.]|nr:hypothetical protein [Treponema sp.]